MLDRYMPPQMLKRLRMGGLGRVPLRRMMTIDEVSALCAFAASAEASGVTGWELLVDGGLLASLHVMPTLT